jgi:hypothetical protein
MGTVVEIKQRFEKEAGFVGQVTLFWGKVSLALLNAQRWRRSSRSRAGIRLVSAYGWNTSAVDTHTGLETHIDKAFRASFIRVLASARLRHLALLDLRPVTGRQRLLLQFLKGLLTRTGRQGN